MPTVSKEQSKIRMVILMGPGRENKVWYSYIKENAKPSSVIIAGMRKRFEANEISKDAQVIQFYENGQLIAEYKS